MKRSDRRRLAAPRLRGDSMVPCEHTRERSAAQVWVAWNLASLDETRRGAGGEWAQDQSPEANWRLDCSMQRRNRGPASLFYPASLALHHCASTGSNEPELLYGAARTRGHAARRGLTLEPIHRTWRAGVSNIARCLLCSRSGPTALPATPKQRPPSLKRLACSQAARPLKCCRLCLLECEPLQMLNPRVCWASRTHIKLPCHSPLLPLNLAPTPSLRLVSHRVCCPRRSLARCGISVGIRSRKRAPNAPADTGLCPR